MSMSKPDLRADTKFLSLGFGPLTPIPTNEILPAHYSSSTYSIVAALTNSCSILTNGLFVERVREGMKDFQENRPESRRRTARMAIDPIKQAKQLFRDICFCIRYFYRFVYNYLLTYMYKYIMLGMCRSYESIG